MTNEITEIERTLRRAGATSVEVSRFIGRASLADLAELSKYVRQQSPIILTRIVDGVRFDGRYVLGHDSQRHPGIAEGKVTEFLLVDSKHYPNVSHRWWLYVPAPLDRLAPTPIMVFTDGGHFVDPNGSWRVPVVFDNLIAKKELPVIAAIFIDPGPGESVTEKESPDAPSYLDMSNRSLEYDTLDCAYADFIVEEIFPGVREQVCITDDPEGRGIAGHSSGGICAFTAAWQRPDEFRKVHCANGSFTNKRGGHIYPDLVRSSASKPIRIWQQSGERDLVHPDWGNWSEANKAMAAALEAKGYDKQFVFGQGSHGPAHAASLFPDAMSWLWRDFPR